MINSNSLGKRLSEARKAKNLTQEAFSELTGMSVSEISRIETGKTLSSLETLLHFCEKLDIGLDYLLYDYFPSDTRARRPAIQQIAALIEPLEDRELDFLLECIRLYTAYHRV